MFKTRTYAFCKTVYQIFHSIFLMAQKKDNIIQLLIKALAWNVKTVNRVKQGRLMDILHTLV